MNVSFTTRPSGESGPVAVWYDVPHGRRRKVFANGFGRAARAFYAAKSKAGKNPKVTKADAGSLFGAGPAPAPAEPASPDPAGIVTPCPSCQAPHPWDACRDTYPTATEAVTPDPDGAELTRWVCGCGGTVAVGVLDRHGLTVYTPTTDTL